MRENCFWIPAQSAALLLFEGGSEMRDAKEPCYAARHFYFLFFTSRPLDVFSHSGLFHHLKRVQSIFN